MKRDPANRALLTAKPIFASALPLGLGGSDVTAARVLTFYSHNRRATWEESEDASELGGIDRRVFCNLYPSPTLAEQGTVPEGATAAGAQLQLHASVVGLKMASTENVFQAAKCKLECDALFIAELDGDDAARFGQGRMTLTTAQRKRLVELGADDADFVPDAAADRAAGVTGEHWRRNSNEWGGKVGHVERRSDWDHVKTYVMLQALRNKFLAPDAPQHRHMAALRALADAGQPVLLCEHTKNDTTWADGSDGRGTNYLGKLLTVVMHEIGTGSGAAALPLPLLNESFLATPMSDICEYSVVPTRAAAGAGEGSAPAGAPSRVDPAAAAREAVAPDWWKAVPCERHQSKRLPNESVDLSRDDAWSITFWKKRGGGGDGELTGAVMIETGDGTHMTLAFLKGLPAGSTGADARRIARAFVASQGVTTVPVRAALTGMWGRKSCLVDPESPLGVLAPATHAHFESLGAGWVVDKDRPAHIEIIKGGGRGAGGRGGRGGGQRGGGDRRVGGGAAATASAAAGAGSGAAASAPAAAPASGGNWWSSVTVPDGKRLVVPVDTVDLSDDSLWSTTPFRRGKGGGMTGAVMVATGGGTHITLAFFSRVPLDTDPKAALALAKSFVHSWVAGEAPASGDGDGASEAGVGTTAFAVKDAMPGMWGRHSALVSETSRLGRLVLALRAHFTSLDTGWEVDTERVPHIEVMKR